MAWVLTLKVQKESVAYDSWNALRLDNKFDKNIFTTGYLKRIRF